MTSPLVSPRPRGDSGAPAVVVPDVDPQRPGAFQTAAGADRTPQLRVADLVGRMGVAEACQFALASGFRRSPRHAVQP